jgi:3-methylfumaryl-CoA hydratase
VTNSYEGWVGREEERTERILAPAAQALAATLDIEHAPQAGDALPPGWQWLFFNPVVRRSGLGTDGHPQRGGFLPPIELPRRMWAGSRVKYLADIAVDATATKRSLIKKVENKTGKRGQLWFVTVEHTTSVGRERCIVEEQDIVYREATPPGTAAAMPAAFDGVAQFGREFKPDTTLLFRYSALTFNGHRIHYDRRYVTEVEGYPGLVVHGPLLATLMLDLLRDADPGATVAAYEFRAIRPTFDTAPFEVCGQPSGDGREVQLWVQDLDGALAMTAKATLR